MTATVADLVPAAELAALRASVERAYPAFLADLERLVDIDCGSYTKAGVDEVGRWVRERLEGNRVSHTPTRKTECHSSPLDRWTVSSLTESAADGATISRPLLSSSSAVR